MFMMPLRSQSADAGKAGFREIKAPKGAAKIGIFTF